VLEGREIIRQMIAEAGEKIIIMVAGKVTPANIEEICKTTGATEFHGKRIVNPA